MWKKKKKKKIIFFNFRLILLDPSQIIQDVWVKWSFFFFREAEFAILVEHLKKPSWIQVQEINVRSGRKCDLTE